MKPRRTGGRSDKNQAGIVAALRKVGASVIITSAMPAGFPDLVVGFRGENVLLEVKNPENSYGRRGFNKHQREWNALWAGSKPIIVRSVEEALIAIGLIPYLIPETEAISAITGNT